MQTTRRRLLANFTSLSSVQIANYLLPLITFPYLVRILGPEKFGLIAFVQAFYYYFVLLTDYGFNLSATREISIHRENRHRVSEIFSAVIAVKTSILVVSMAVVLVLILSMDRFRREWLVCLFTFIQLPSMVIFPLWLFQGMERMKLVAVLNLVPRLVFTILVFPIIRVEADYVFVPLLTSIGSIVAGLAAFIIGVRLFGITFTLPTRKMIVHELREGWHFFVSTVAISLYTISNPFVLGLLTNPAAVGYYTAAEKIIRAVLNLFQAFSQTIYPHISWLAAQSRETAIAFIRKITFLAGLATFLLSLGFLLGARPICLVILGPEYTSSVPILQILAFLPFVISLSNIFSMQGLYAFGYPSVVVKFVLAIALFHIVLVTILTMKFSAFGTAVSALVSECIITLCAIHYFNKHVLSEKNSPS